MPEHDPVTILYQMGKVGSTSVHDALLSSELETPVHKIHFLSDQGIAHGEKFHQKTLKNPWAQTPHLQTTHLLRQKMAEDPNLEMNIVTLVREPVGREVSEFFQYVEALHPELLDDEGRLDVGRAHRVLQARFMFYDETSNYTCRWFDMEIKELFGLDVFSVPFDHDRGYTLVQEGQVRLLILRLEDLDRALNQGLRELLGPSYRDWAGRANEGAKKERGDQYRELVDGFRLRGRMATKVYSTTYARHFYTQDERDAFAEHWTRPLEPQARRAQG